MKSKLLKVVVFAPIEVEDKIRKAIEDFGGGRVGNYTGWTFTSAGVTRVKALPGSHPTVGEIGKVETIDEVRIETTCYENELSTLVAAIKTVHPYEQVPIDVIEIREI